MLKKLMIFFGMMRKLKLLIVFFLLAWAILAKAG